MSESVTFSTAIVAAIVSVLTLLVSRKALKACPGLDNPLVPFCVAGLCFLGLTTLGAGWAEAILALYAALGIAILLTLLFGWASNRRKSSARALENRKKAKTRDLTEQGRWQSEDSGRTEGRHTGAQ